MTHLNHESILKMGRYGGLSLDGVDAETAKKLHRFMLRLRRCEEALMAEYHPAEEMRCPVHFCIGQEAVPAALSLLLTPEDYAFSHHRSHGYFLAKDAPMRALFAELYGRESGANGGLAGSQEISMPSVNFYSGAIVAGAAAIAAGASFAMGLQDKRSVTIAGFGEAATEEGIFSESLNLAAVRELPLVLVCENNHYSMFSPQLKRQPADNLSQRVAANGIESRAVFGNDVVAVHRVLAEAIAYARDGRGTFFVEAYTYRWHGHVGPEDDDHYGYRPKQELEFWESNCPIALLEEQMVVHGLLSEDTKSAIIDEVDAEIADAFDFAKSSPFPSLSNWEELNFNPESPMADRLLVDIESADFDQNQDMTIPRPY